MTDEQKREKLRAFPYIIGSLSFIPVFGVIFGIISISWGLVTKKIGGKKLVVIGCCGIAFSLILYIYFYYIVYVERGGIVDEQREKLSRYYLINIVQALELYKTQNGYYPESLKLLKESFPKWTWLVIYDASILRIEERRYFYYEIIDKDHYYLLGVGLDGMPFTSDDILPKIQAGPDNQVGLRVKSKDNI